MRLDDSLYASVNDAIRSILQSLDQHGPGEADHAARVAVYAVATADELGLSEDELISIRHAALLHDIGKIAVDRELLNKMGELNEEDFRALRLHAALGAEVLRGLTWLGNALPMIVHHHERWDGQGYPQELKGEEIPIGARIIAVAEVFDHVAFGSYIRPPQGRDQALIELRQGANSQFDPSVVNAFLKVELLIQPLEAYA